MSIETVSKDTRTNNIRTAQIYGPFIDSKVNSFIQGVAKKKFL